MTTLPVPLEILQKIRLQMHMGKSLNSSLENVLAARMDFFSKSLKVWLVKTGAGQKQQEILKTLPELGNSPQRRQLIYTLERGLKGSSIDEILGDLEKEFYFCIEDHFERKLQVLPLKLLIPLMIFILPAVMGIIIAPFLFSMRGM